MTSNYNYAYFTQDANRWDSATEAFWGLHDICPFLMQFHVSGITRADLSAISQAGGWGNPKKQSQGMASLLLAPSQEVEEEKRVWPGGGICPPQPIPSFLSKGGSKETYLTYQHKEGLVLHPCVIYPGYLNGGLEPVLVTLLKLPLWEMGSYQ